MLFFCLLLLNTGTNSDLEYIQTITYSLTESRKGYRLQSKVKVKQQFLSDRCLDMAQAAIPESYYVSIDKLKGKVNGSNPKKGWASEIHPEFEDVFLSDVVVHRLDFSANLKRGDVVEYEYEKTYANPAFMSPILIPNIQGAVTRLEFNHPKDVTAQFEFFFPREDIPYKIERRPRSTLLEFTSLSNWEALPFFAFNDAQAYVLPYFEKNGLNICNSTEKTFNAWYKNLIGNVPALKDETVALAHKLTDEFKEPGLKLQALNDYVKTQIRYLADEAGKHAIVPRMPDTVLERKWGDCKDRALLILELAKAIGIKVHIALIATDERPPFQHIRVGHYNHAICAWRDGDVWRFFDPTQQSYPFGVLPATEQAKWAFIIGDDTGFRVQTPSDANLPLMEISLEMDAAQPENGVAKITLYRDLFAFAEKTLRKSDSLGQENSLSNMVNDYFRKISFDYFQLDEKKEQQMTFLAKADMSKFLIQSPTKLYAPMIPFQIFDRDVLKRELDNHLIYTHTQGMLSLELKLTHEGYQSVPKSLNSGDIEAAGFQASLQQVQETSSLLRYEISLDRRVYDADHREAYLKLVQDHYKNRNAMFILKRGENP